MSKETNKPENTDEPLSEKQLIELRAKATAFYSDELPALRLEAEYEKLNAEIEESKVRKLIAVGKSAYIFAQAESAASEAASEAGKKDTPKS